MQIAAYWLGWEPSTLLVRIASSLSLYSMQEDTKHPALKFQTALVAVPLTLGRPLSPSTIDPPTTPTTLNIPPRAPSSIGQHSTLPHQRVSHKTADRIVRDVLFAMDRPGRGDSLFWCVFPTPLVLFHTDNTIDPVLTFQTTTDSGSLTSGPNGPPLHPQPLPCS